MMFSYYIYCELSIIAFILIKTKNIKFLTFLPYFGKSGRENKSFEVALVLHGL